MTNINTLDENNIIDMTDMSGVHTCIYRLDAACHQCCLESTLDAYGDDVPCRD